MKYLSALFLSMLVSIPALADATYAYTNPTYIPTAVSPAASLSAPGNYTFTNNGLSVATLRVTGTCTSLAGTLQGSNDGTNFADIPLASLPGGSSTVAISGAGFWKANIGGYSSVRVHVTALTAACTFAMAATPNGAVHADPCANPSIKHSSVVVNQGASATTKVVDAVAGKTVYVCGFVATGAGTNPTATFITGTHTTTDCDTTPANLSGAMVFGAANGVVAYQPGATVMQSIGSGQVCLTTAATTSIQGVLNYVQQ